MISSTLKEDHDLTPEKILDARIKQLKNSKKIARIVFDSNLLTSEQQIKILSIMGAKMISYLDAYKTLEDWDSTIHSDLERILQSSLVSLNEFI